jgi:general secretion pathway protein D
MNNQQAVLSFAFNQVFFTLDVQEQEDRFGDSLTKTLNIDSNVNTIPIGVILNLQPSIDTDTDEITMNIRPTLSRIKSEIDVPGVTFLAARNNIQNVRSTIPIVEVRELDSILKIHSGQIMVIGGLMEERSSNDETGVPILSTAPLIGKLFKGVAKDSQVVETVIFIKAPIVPGYGVSKEDQHLYRTFVRDPRPLAF